MIVSSPISDQNFDDSKSSMWKRLLDETQIFCDFCETSYRLKAKWEIIKRQTWNKPLAEIEDDEHAVIKKLAQNQHAWAFPDFVSRGGAMQFEEIFQCWKVKNYEFILGWNNRYLSVQMRERTENVVKRVKLSIVQRNKILVLSKLWKRKFRDTLSQIMMFTKVEKESF